MLSPPDPPSEPLTYETLRKQLIPFLDWLDEQILEILYFEVEKDNPTQWPIDKLCERYHEIDQYFLG